MTRYGVWIDIWFTKLSKLVTTGHYNALANSCNRLLTKAHIDFSVFLHSSRRFATAHNNTDSSASVFNVSCPRWLRLTSNLLLHCRFSSLDSTLPAYPGSHWLSLAVNGLTAKFLLTFASTVILASETHGTHVSGSLPNISLAVNCSGRLNCYWPSPAQSFLTSVSWRSMAKIFVPS
jgi:hypothetical protein